MLYGKPTGAGTAVALTNQRLAGTGVPLTVSLPTPLATNEDTHAHSVDVDALVATASGLIPNESYVFAVAAYDAKHALIGNGIGETCAPLLAALPLPTEVLWAHLAVASATRGYRRLAQHAAAAAVARWVDVGPCPPIWAASGSPGNSLSLRHHELSTAPRPTMYAVARCLGILAESFAGDARVVLPERELRCLPEADDSARDNEVPTTAGSLALQHERLQVELGLEVVGSTIDDTDDGEAQRGAPTATRRTLGPTYSGLPANADDHVTSIACQATAQDEGKVQHYSAAVTTQVAAVRRVQCMSMAVEAACALRDPALIMQTVCACYTLATPLLRAWTLRGAWLMQPLVACHQALQLLPTRSWHTPAARTFAAICGEIAAVVTPVYSGVALASEFDAASHTLLRMGPGSGPDVPVPARLPSAEDDSTAPGDGGEQKRRPDVAVRGPWVEEVAVPPSPYVSPAATAGQVEGATATAPQLDDARPKLCQMLLSVPEWRAALLRDGEDIVDRASQAAGLPARLAQHSETLYKQLDEFARRVPGSYEEATTALEELRTRVTGLVSEDAIVPSAAAATAAASALTDVAGGFPDGVAQTAAVAALVARALLAAAPLSASGSSCGTVLSAIGEVRPVLELAAYSSAWKPSDPGAAEDEAADTAADAEAVVNTAAPFEKMLDDAALMRVRGDLFVARVLRADATAAVVREAKLIELCGADAAFERQRIAALEAQRDAARAADKARAAAAAAAKAAAEAADGDDASAAKAVESTPSDAEVDPNAAPSPAANEEDPDAHLVVSDRCLGSSWHVMLTAASADTTTRARLLQLAQMEMVYAQTCATLLLAEAEAVARRGGAGDGESQSASGYTGLGPTATFEPDNVSQATASFPVLGSAAPDVEGDDVDAAGQGADESKAHDALVDESLPPTAVSSPAGSETSVRHRANATLASCSRVCVRARAVCAWGLVRNASRVAWNTIVDAWAGPECFCQPSQETPSLEGAESKDGGDDAGEGEAAGDGDSGEGDDSSPSEAAVAPMDWRCLLRISLAILDLFEAIGTSKVELAWTPFASMQADGQQDQADDFISEDMQSQGSGDEEAALAAANSGTALPVGMVPDDIVWLAKFVCFTCHALCYAAQWDSVVEIGERLQVVCPLGALGPVAAEAAPLAPAPAPASPRPPVPGSEPPVDELEDGVVKSRSTCVAEDTLAVLDDTGRRLECTVSPTGRQAAEDCLSQVLPMAIYAARKLFDAARARQAESEAELAEFEAVRANVLAIRAGTKKRKRATLEALKRKYAQEDAVYRTQRVALAGTLAKREQTVAAKRLRLEALDSRLAELDRDLSVARASLSSSRKLLAAYVTTSQERAGATVPRLALDDSSAPAAPVSLPDVVNSYRRSVTLLRRKQETLLLSQALHELGLILLSCGGPDGRASAVSTWNDGVDACFGRMGAVENWRDTLATLVPDTVSKLGVVGAVLPAVMCSRLAQCSAGAGEEDHVLTYMLFAAPLLASVFASSAQHPQRASDFRVYRPVDVGAPCSSLFADVRCLAPADVATACRNVVVGLLAYGTCFVERTLPVISLLEAVAVDGLCSVARAIDTRLLRARALLLGGDIHGSVQSIADIVGGVADLPHRGGADSGSEATPATEALAPYHNHLSPFAPSNRAALAWLCDDATARIPDTILAAIKRRSADAEGGFDIPETLSARLQLVRAEICWALGSAPFVSMQPGLTLSDDDAAGSNEYDIHAWVRAHGERYAAAEADNAGDAGASDAFGGDDLPAALLERAESLATALGATGNDVDSVDAKKLRVAAGVLRGRVAAARGLHRDAAQHISASLRQLTSARGGDGDEPSVAFEGTFDFHEGQSVLGLRLGLPWWLHTKALLVQQLLASGAVAPATAVCESALAEARACGESVLGRRLLVCRAECAAFQGDLATGRMALDIVCQQDRDTTPDAETLATALVAKAAFATATTASATSQGEPAPGPAEVQAWLQEAESILSARLAALGARSDAMRELYEPRPQLDSLYFPFTATLADVRCRLSMSIMDSALAGPASALLAGLRDALAMAELAHATLRHAVPEFVEPAVRAQCLLSVGRLRRMLLQYHPGMRASTGKPQFRLPLGASAEDQERSLEVHHPFRQTSVVLRYALRAAQQCGSRYHALCREALRELTQLCVARALLALNCAPLTRSCVLVSQIRQPLRTWPRGGAHPKRRPLLAVGVPGRSRRAHVVSRLRILGSGRRHSPACICAGVCCGRNGLRGVGRGLFGRVQPSTRS